MFTYTRTILERRDHRSLDVNDEMNSWTPLGRLLTDYHEGDTSAEAEVIWEDGARVPLSAEVFFREPEEFSDAETAALELCRGRVLDVGAGAGCHTLALQDEGHGVLALDVCREAVDVMRRRGVREAVHGDVFQIVPERHDTLLLLMNGIGLVGDLAGLDRFLRLAHRLLAPDGQILLDSSDVRLTDDVEELRRIVTRVRSGRYRGESRQQIEYRGLRGAPLDWLYLDAETLGRHARHCGWREQVVYEGPDGSYVARLVRRRRDL